MPRNIDLKSLEDQIQDTEKAIAKHKETLVALRLRDSQEKERLQKKRALEIGMIALASGLSALSDGELEKLFLSFTEKTSLPSVQG